MRPDGRGDRVCLDMAPLSRFGSPPCGKSPIDRLLGLVCRARAYHSDGSFMNAPAALLYVQEAAWQSPRVPEDPVDAGDPHHVEPRDAFKALRAFAAHWGPLVVGIFALAGAYYDIKSDLKLQTKDISSLKDDIRNGLEIQAKDISSLKAWAKSPGQFPGTQTAPPPSAQPVPSAVNPDPQASTPSTVQGLRGFPSSVPPTSPPECVSSKLFTKMPCEQAAKNTCRGLSGFTSERYRDIRIKAGVGEYMLVCDEK